MCKLEAAGGGAGRAFNRNNQSQYDIQSTSAVCHYSNNMDHCNGGMNMRLIEGKFTFASSLCRAPAIKAEVTLNVSVL